MPMPVCAPITTIVRVICLWPLQIICQDLVVEKTSRRPSPIGATLGATFWVQQTWVLNRTEPDRGNTTLTAQPTVQANRKKIAQANIQTVAWIWLGSGRCQWSDELEYRLGSGGTASVFDEVEKAV
ncbi:hypothetical protein B0H12DRAFT_1075461 [Mycena haematopus]|nr:hypothetical protein B0H12DRAFT_1075461 [Mycena haematopus]